MPPRLRALVLVLVLALLAVCAGAASAGRTTAQPGKIVFAADRAPLWYGEIYRLGLDGRRVDLSRSPAQDVDPAVSPDGRLVAFASNRGGRAALYTVGIDGMHLRRVSLRFFAHPSGLGGSTTIEWSADGTRIAAALQAGEGGAFWIGDRAGHGRVVARGPVVAPAWAPDGHALAYEPGVDEVDVISPAGKLLWSVLGDAQFAAWSREGRLAVRYHGQTIRLYGEQGRLLGSFKGRQLAWSPDGRQLASLAGRRLQVREGGLGPPTVDVRLPRADGTIQWLGGRRLRVATASGWVGLDVAAKKRWTLPPAFAAFDPAAAVSSDGARIAVGAQSGSTVRLRVAAMRGGVGPVLRSAPECHDDLPFSALRFTPNGRALVYQSGCPAPSADIYAIAGDGSGLRQLTQTPVDETQPSVSPDGTQIAYVQEPGADRCEGCPHTIWQMNADGTEQRELTPPAPGGDAWDDRPRWSPDGAAIRFWHSTISSPGYAVEIPAGGGVQRRLSLPGGYPVPGPTRIAYVTPKGVVRTALPDGSDARAVTTDPNVLAETAAWSRDGRLAFLDTTKSGALRLVIAGATLERHPLGGLVPPWRGTGLAWSPDGTRLAFTAADSAAVTDLYVVAADGTSLHGLTHGLGAIGALSWTGG